MTRHVRFTSWSGAGLLAGDHDGTALATSGLGIARPAGTRCYEDPHREGARALFEEAAWTSPEVVTGFPAEEVVVSWNASTPPGGWVEVCVDATLDDGRRTGWCVLGRWAETDLDICPTSVAGQDGDAATVEVDTLRARPGHGFTGYRVRATLLRRPAGESPSVRLVGAMASAAPGGGRVACSPAAGAEGLLVDVPAFSQQVHRGEYPHWGEGGEAWCSPTATSMVLAHWGRLPREEEYAWVDPRFRDRFVDHAARHTYDHSYRGAGNWPFNTAYAARYGTTAFVTRLRGLHEAELFLRAGIPLVAGVSFTEEELAGAGYATRGHLLAVVGFTEAGDVVCNDPASHGLADNAQVRTVYDRDQLENAWLRSSGGIVYVIRPPEVPLPPAPPEANW